MYFGYERWDFTPTAIVAALKQQLLNQTTKCGCTKPWLQPHGIYMRFLQVLPFLLNNSKLCMLIQSKFWILEVCISDVTVTNFTVGGQSGLIGKEIQRIRHSKSCNKQQLVALHGICESVAVRTAGLININVCKRGAGLIMTEAVIWSRRHVEAAAWYLWTWMVSLS